MESLDVPIRRLVPDVLREIFLHVVRSREYSLVQRNSLPLSLSQRCTTTTSAKSLLQQHATQRSFLLPSNIILIAPEMLSYGYGQTLARRARLCSLC
ncbi:hypothetical protein BD626DRAFT_511135 [Schizophyllum amplum]|uniref:F-box domain-containing protein n=1 Tax=Schizophyllum amplum TaxID=97359 RepID=A0A550C0Z8_9AGAR|nr:hypothetical protein BD626DRAFT_511135 [Auriculariopsis ampla]